MLHWSPDGTVNYTVYYPATDRGHSAFSDAHAAIIENQRLDLIGQQQSIIRTQLGGQMCKLYYKKKVNLFQVLPRQSKA